MLGLQVSIRSIGIRTNFVNKTRVPLTFAEPCLYWGEERSHAQARNEQLQHRY